MKQFKYLDNFITQLALRQSEFIMMRDQMLTAKVGAMSKQHTLNQALRYEQLLARIDELGKVTCALIEINDLEEKAVFDVGHLEAYLRQKSV